MPGVAINGSQLNESIKSGHVTYSIENWVPRYCASYDPDTGACIRYEGGFWEDAGTGSTGAKITGTVTVSASKMKVAGVLVATVGDATNETWVAYPPIPSSNSSTRYTATSATSGSGRGSISRGSTKGKLQGKAIALVGSTVTTCLGTTTTIKSGNEKLKFNN